MSVKTLNIALALAIGLASCQKDRPIETLKPATPVDESRELQQMSDLLNQLDQEDQAILALSATGRSNSSILIPAGSSDALNPAIAASPAGGTIILAEGDHTESGMVTVNKTVRIIGRRGARLITQSAPFEQAGVIQAGFYVTGASDVSISNVEMIPAGEIGGTAVLLFNAPNAKIFRNTISGYQFGVLVEQSDEAFIAVNQIQISSAWRTGAIANAIGVNVINGERAFIYGNQVENAFLGIWPCDKNGKAIANQVSDCHIGFIFCKDPVFLPLPNGTVVGAEFPATDWIATHNQAKNNGNIGYLVIDGANGNYLGFSNKGSGNALYDIELTSDTYRFGYFVPASFNNTVIARPNMTVKDCGNNNHVTGGIAVDTNAEPCN